MSSTRNLNSSFLLKYDAITGYCKAAKNYCPPGIQGPPGLNGKGVRGDVGLPGPSGKV